MRELLTDLAVLAGGVLIAVAAALVAVPLGVFVAGVLLVAVGYWQGS